ncbi:hypothetical protein HK097_003927 [Rhizophlyctis rosea]|uniref:Uncharacterized protein n=1 Tax=Rhizophlyctis rosea TaxID=64517 RepID=A0AAD5WXN6_9FUNG|nr:hypothetical protein HK097_003927 [Rhizophlyctis rosea]
MSKAPPSGGPPPGYTLVAASGFQEIPAHFLLNDPLCDKTGTQLCGTRDVESAGSLCDKLKDQGCVAFVCWATTIRADVNNPCLLFTEPLRQMQTDAMRGFVRLGTQYTNLQNQTVYAGGAPTTTTTTAPATSSTTSPTSTQTSESSSSGSSSSSSSNTGAIAGGVVGGLVVLGAIFGLLLWRRKKARKEPVRLENPPSLRNAGDPLVGSGKQLETPEFHTTSK